jgi:hypothetical protein
MGQEPPPPQTNSHSWPVTHWQAHSSGSLTHTEMQMCTHTEVHTWLTQDTPRYTHSSYTDMYTHTIKYEHTCLTTSAQGVVHTHTNRHRFKNMPISCSHVLTHRHTRAHSNLHGDNAVHIEGCTHMQGLCAYGTSISMGVQFTPTHPVTLSCTRTFRQIDAQAHAIQPSA